MGHCWKALPTNVTKGSWCPECAHRKQLTVREMRALAEHRGGECRPDRYINNRTKLTWRCATGHQGGAAPGLVKGGVWYPYCARVARLLLEGMAAITASLGGRCRSIYRRYIIARPPLPRPVRHEESRTGPNEASRSPTSCDFILPISSRRASPAYARPPRSSPPRTWRWPLRVTVWTVASCRTVSR